MAASPTRWTRWLPLLYLVFGTSWILGSDAILAWLFESQPQLLWLAGTIKGFVFVGATALLFAVWWRYEQRHSALRARDAEQRADIATQRLGWITRRANDAILLVDEDGAILDCNERAELLYGFSRSQLLAMSVFKLRLPGSDSLRQASAQLDAVRLQGSLVFEAVHQRQDGSTFPVEVSSNRTTYEGRVYIQSIVRDISERKELERAREAAESALHEGELRHRHRVEHQRDLYGLLSRCNHVVARVSDKHSLFQSIVRLSVETGGFLAAWIGELHDDGSVAKVARFGGDDGYIDLLVVSARADEQSGQGPIGLSLREGKSVVVNRFLESALTTRWHDVARGKGIRACASVPIRTLGKVTATLALYATEEDFFDPEIVATLEEMAEEISFGLDGLHLRSQLEESRNLLQAIIDASATPVYAFDRQGRALLMNQSCARMFGRPLEDLIGRNREVILSPEEAAASGVADRQVIETGETLSVEERMTSDGREHVFLSVKFPLRSVDGKIMAVGGISTEITELRRAQEEAAAANTRLEETVAARTLELVAARDQAQYADQAKTAFLSTVSHELRTPLNSIIGFTEVVVQGLAGPLTDEQRHQLGIVQDSARMLLALINDILDLSRIEAGRLQLAIEEFDLADLLRRKVEALASQAAAKGLLLEADVTARVGRMTSDPKRVAQIVSNLLSNAVKFTDRGRIVLRADAHGEQVVIAVHDTGHGIAANDIARLFRPFVQVGGSRSHHHDGTGLGLAISMQLARALGGDITVHSTPGEGSRFTVTLPLRSAPAADMGSTGLFRSTAPHA